MKKKTINFITFNSVSFFF